MYRSITDKTEPLVSKQLPLYATRCKYRSPEVKYQTKGHAKLALRNKISTSSYGNKRILGNITIYRLDQSTGLYDPIFTHDSELAEAFRIGIYTADQMVERIPW